MASLFDTLQAGAQRAGVTARTKESQKWFQKNVKNLAVSRKGLLKDDALERTSRNIRGNMYMYFYDPKFKADLPYYDRFPLTIMVDGAPGGFYGLNLHYLNYGVRARFLDELMALGPAQAKENSRLTKLRYNLLTGVKKYKEFKPCFKHYLGKHVVSQFSRVPMTDWEIAVFLPVEQFKKKSKAAVWNESLKIARS
tara:strand:- start:1896 stop:2483 length:588 start_codon:yes stop_codon:yes gene_type:complete